MPLGGRYPAARRNGTSPAPHFFFHFLQLNAEEIVLRLALFHSIQGRKNGGVVTVEQLADVGKRHFGNRADKVNRHMTRGGNLLGAPRGNQILPLDVKR